MKKVTAATIAVVAAGALFSLTNKPVDASETVDVKLEVEEGIVTIGSTGAFDMGTISASTSVQVIENQFTGTDNAFFVEDLKGADAGYYTTISSTDMVGANGTISNTNIYLKTPDATTSLITGTANTDVVVAAAFDNTYQSLDTARTFIQRASGTNSGRIGQYGVLPFLQINVPAFQAVGEYSATLTYTLYEN